MSLPCPACPSELPTQADLDRHLWLTHEVGRDPEVRGRALGRIDQGQASPGPVLELEPAEAPEP